MSFATILRERHVNPISRLKSKGVIERWLQRMDLASQWLGRRCGVERLAHPCNIARIRQRLRLQCCGRNRRDAHPTERPCHPGLLSSQYACEVVPWGHGMCSLDELYPVLLP